MGGVLAELLHGSHLSNSSKTPKRWALERERNILRATQNNQAFPFFFSIKYYMPPAQDRLDALVAERAVSDKRTADAGYRYREKRGGCV